MRIIVRYNTKRGISAGTIDHYWRVITPEKSRVFKNVRINVPCWGEKTGEDFSMACEGELTIDAATSTANIN